LKINNNPNKIKMLFIFLVIIIAILFIAIVYQFVCIKSMEKQLNDSQSESYISSKNNY